jgi:hypothetical protein
MRRVYYLYHRQQAEDGQTDLASPWLCDGTLVIDTTALELSSAGPVLHSYEVMQAVRQRGEDALERVLIWDDEVWLAVEIGDVGADEGIREIMERANATAPPPAWPTRPEEAC